MKRNILVSLMLILVSCSSLNNQSNPNKIKLRLLHTNDHHGHYLPNEKGEYGMSPRKTLIDKLRSENNSNGGYGLLLSGGDINTGTMESDIFDAEPDFLGMKALGYDAMAIGNHEFDNSFKVIKKQQELAGFPFLSANIFYKGTKKRVFQPEYIVKTFGNIKVGIFGLTTVDTPFKASHEDAKTLFDFRNIIDSAKDIVKKLKEKEKVDFIFVTTHIGHHGSATSNGDIKLAMAVPEIDVIVGGHSQEIINAEKHNNTIVIQAMEWGKYVGVLDLELSKTNKEKKQISYKLIPVNLKNKVDGEYVFVEKEISTNDQMENLFAKYKKEAEIIGSKKVGVLDSTLDGDRFKVRTSQAEIAQFMGRAVRDKFRDVDSVIINGGSIRDSLPAGDITRKKIHAVHPYGNSIGMIKFNAKEFFEYCEKIIPNSVVDKQNILGGYPHLINMKWYFQNKKLVKIASRDGKWSITKNKSGKISSKKKQFIYSTLNFLARGGDNYPKISNHKNYVDTGFMINTIMMDFVEKRKIIRKNDYKISDKEVLIKK